MKKQMKISLFVIIMMTTLVFNTGSLASTAAPAATPTITLTSPVINGTYIVNGATVTLGVTNSNNTLFYNWDDNSNSSTTVSGDSASITAPSTEGSHNLSVFAANATGTGEWSSKYYEFTVQQETLSAVLFTISSTSESGYTAEAAISFSFRSWQNFTTLKFYYYVILNGYSTILESDSLTHSSYYAANGTITKTTTLYMDHTKTSWKYVSREDTLILYVKAYNSSIDSSNLLDSETATDTYPFVTTSSDSDSISTATKALAIASLMTLVAVVIGGICIFMYAGTRGVFDGTPLGSPFNYFSNESTRSRVKFGNKSRYVVRGKDGRIKDVQNINRSIRQDSARKAEYHPKRPGKGHLGDYRKR